MAIRAVTCSLGGKDRELRLDMGAMAALEDQGYTVEQLVSSLSEGNLSAKRILALLWAMLQSEDQPPSLKEVGRWVDGENFEAVLQSVGEALRLAFPKKPKEGAGPPRRGAGTGTRPSALPTVPSA